MKLNAKKPLKWSVVPVFMAIFLTASASIMNHIQINTAVKGCVEKNMTPNVEKDLLAFNWSFSCERN